MDNITNVYYDKKEKKFVQLRESLERGWLCGGYTNYYNDAITTICELRLSNKYIIKNLVLVEYVDEFASFDGIGWKI